MQERILLIEQVTILREALANYFVMKGYEVIQYGTGLDIEQICLTEKFDVVITNLNLDKMYGIDVIRKIKSILPNVKTIGMSMFYRTWYAKDLKEVGADAYILKGMLPETHLKIVQDVIAGGQFFVSE